MWWIVGGIAAIAAFTVVAVLLNNGESSKKTEGPGMSRPGFQDVIVKDGVDVSTQQYVSGIGAFFPNIDGVQSTPTVVTEGSVTKWCIVFRDMITGRKYRKSFTTQITLGRDPVVRNREARLVISDDLVSKTHCIIQGRTDSLTITDVGSKNGTFLNGIRIDRTMQLNSGDRLNIGNTLLEIQAYKE